MRRNMPVVSTWLAWLIVVSISLPSVGADDAGEPSLATAHGMLNRGLYDLAEKEYRRVLAGEPNGETKTQARYGLAVSLVRQRRYEPAIPLLTKLLGEEKFAFGADSTVLLAQCRLATGDYRAAADVIAANGARFDGHPLADDALAIGIESLYRGGSFKACAKNAATFMKQFADSPLAGRVCAHAGLSLAALREDGDAVEQLRAALARGVPDGTEPHVQLALAESLHRLGKRAEAVEAFEAVSRSGGALAPRAQLGQAVALWESGDVKSARAKVEAALRAPAGIDASYANLIRGRILFDAGEYGAARKAFVAASTDKSSVRDRAVYGTAKCLLRDDKAEDAVAILEEAVAAFPDSERIAEMRYDLAVALIRLERTDRAIAALSEFLSHHGRSALSQDARRMLAGALHRAGRYEESDGEIAAWRESSGASGLPAELAFVHAENAFLSGDYEAAAARFASYLSLEGIDERRPIARRRLGLAHYRLKQYDKALEQLATLGEAAQTPATLFAVGDIHFSKRNWKDARSWLDRFVLAAGDAPTDEALLKSGIACMRLDEHETALRRFDSLIERGEKGPNQVQAVFERGQALVALERFEEAAKALQRVLKMEGGERFAAASREHLAAIGLRLGRPDLAAETYAALAKTQKNEQDRASARLRQAQALIQAGDFAKAAEVLAGWIDEFGDDDRRDEALANYVIASARTEDCEKAIAAFERMHPEKVEPQLMLAAQYDHAWCLRSLKRDADAATAFEQVVASANGSPLGHHAMMELAAIYTESGWREESIAHLKTLAGAYREGKLPGDLPADRVLYRLGQALFETDQLADAQAALTELRSKFPASEFIGPAAYLLGEAAFRAEKWEAAAAQLTTALERGAEAAYRGPALLRLGDTLGKLQRWKESESRFAAYLKANADSEFAFQANFGIGWARENDGRYAEAMEAYRRVTAHHDGPTAARAQFQIGQCLFAEKDYEGAVRELIKTDILYAYPEWSAAALFEAGRCLERMNRRGEAREQFDAVAKKYGKTKWAAPATERLRALASAGEPQD